MKLEGKIKHGIALAIDHNDYVDCDVVYYGGMTIRLVNASYDDLSIAFGPVGSYVDMNAFYTKEEIDNKGYLTEHQDISGKADKVDTYTKAETNTLLDAKANVSTTYTKSEVDTLISNVDIDIDDTPTSGSDHAVSSGGVYDSLVNKQDTLISGTNIKTINGVSVLGSGDIDADDVVVGKLENDKFYTVTISGLGTKTFSSTPVTGDFNKLYADILTFKLYWYGPKIIQFGSDEVHYKLIGGVDETDPIFTASAAHGITSADIVKWNSKVDSSDLASVATSGSYNDLSDKPDIPQAQVQSDWNESDSSKVDYIKNKPTIPTVPSNVSAFNNDAGYLTTETDPTVPNHVKGITQQNITNWNGKVDSSDLANYYTKSEVNSALDDKQDTITDLATIRSGASLGATAYQKPNGGIPKSDLASSVQTSLGLADSALQQHQDLSSLADGAEYDSSEKKIYLKHGNTRLSNPIDATEFIKDGMIDTVTVTNGNLVITFNTDAGKQPISLPISRIFDANNYYTKTEIDNKGYLTNETDPVFGASVAAGIKSTDIASWNAKQSAIADLDDIRTGASLGATALQSYTETDPVFSASVAHGITSSDIANWNSKTSNVGTITGITMNGASKGTSGVVDLGTVITEHQDISGKVDKETGKGLSSNDYTDAEKTKLSGIATGAEVNVQSDWNQTTTTADDYIKNKPSLATVATSGSYSDLSNKPTIPTVNNATLTIQKNGTTVGTFTANASSNVTANISVPTKVSDLTNDSGFITGYTETDPTVPAWAKASSKPTYTASEVGALPDTTVIPSKTSDLTNDSGFITGYTETDPTVPSWAKQSTKPTYNGGEIKYTGTTGNVVTNNTTLNVALKAIDDAIGNVETLLASI